MTGRTAFQEQFTGALMNWHRHVNRRSMPWKGEPDPYKIWLSEIILQQTRVEQGLSYYLRFTEAYPDIFSLAGAADTEVFKLWEGLGYYSRCRNLLHTARTIVRDYQGFFPESYEGLVKLKGIGPYTAAAIASFAFGLPFAVVDGNVIRILARYFLDYTPFNGTGGKEHFQQLANLVLDTGQPAAFNQAIMDFGATVCKPVSPDCHICPMQTHCLASAQKVVPELPVRLKKAVKKDRYFVYLIFKNNHTVWIRERTGKDIWRHLHEFFLIELSSHEAFLKFNIGIYCRDNNWGLVKTEEIPGIFEQTLTHQRIKSRFFTLESDILPQLPGDGKWIGINEIRQLAFPKTLTQIGYLFKNETESGLKGV